MIKAATTKESRGTALRKMRRAMFLGFFNNTAIFSFI